MLPTWNRADTSDGHGPRPPGSARQGRRFGSRARPHHCRSRRLYMGDEDGAFSFVYSGWAQCALPHRRWRTTRPWEICRPTACAWSWSRAGGRRATTGRSNGSACRSAAHARLILLYLQTQALKTGSREIELGELAARLAAAHRRLVGGRTGPLVKEQAERISRCRLSFHLAGRKTTGLINQSIVDRALFIEDVEDRRADCRWRRPSCRRAFSSS